MSWCDKLASTPTVGFRLDPCVASGDALVDALSPIMTRYVDEQTVRFQIEKHETMGISFNTFDGFRYGADQNRIHVAFNHRMKVIQVSGGAPVLEMLSKPLPFTILLPEVFDRLVEATVLLPSINTRKLDRVGVVSETFVDEEDIPPGITELISYLSHPWGSAPQHYSYNASVIVEESENWTDECLYTVTKSPDPDALITLSFDWGRKFKTPRSASKDELRQIPVEVCHDSRPGFQRRRWNYGDSLLNSIHGLAATWSVKLSKPSP